MKTWESHIVKRWRNGRTAPIRSEEHTSELQSQSNLVCRLLLEKKKHNDVSTISIRYTTTTASCPSRRLLTSPILSTTVHLTHISYYHPATASTFSHPPRHITPS